VEEEGEVDVEEVDVDVNVDVEVDVETVAESDAEDALVEDGLAVRTARSAVVAENCGEVEAVVEGRSRRRLQPRAEAKIAVPAATVADVGFSPVVAVRRVKPHQERDARPAVASTLTQDEFAAVLTWAYVVHVRLAKSALGKRAVVRNRAKRRVAAAVRAVFPHHACRGREYAFFVLPAALVTPFPDLVKEAREALVQTRSYRAELSPEQMQRPWYKRPSSR
jgi:RNase P protein component